MGDYVAFATRKDTGTPENSSGFNGFPFPPTVVESLSSDQSAVCLGPMTRQQAMNLLYRVKKFTIRDFAPQPIFPDLLILEWETAHTGGTYMWSWGNEQHTDFEPLDVEFTIQSTDRASERELLTPPRGVEFAMSPTDFGNFTISGTLILFSEFTGYLFESGFYQIGVGSDAQFYVPYSIELHVDDFSAAAPTPRTEVDSDIYLGVDTAYNWAGWSFSDIPGGLCGPGEVYGGNDPEFTAGIQFTVLGDSWNAKGIQTDAALFGNGDGPYKTSNFTFVFEATEYWPYAAPDRVLYPQPGYSVGDPHPNAGNPIYNTTTGARLLDPKTGF